MLTTSPTSRYALAKSFSLRLLPRRLYAIESTPTKTEVLLSRLFRSSVYSLRGYAEAKELTAQCRLVNFVDVVAGQRYAQCRELAMLLRYIDSAPDTALHEVTTLKLDWKNALSHLQDEDLVGFARCACRAERRLEIACLMAARRVDSSAISERLQMFAVSISGVCERMDEMLDELRC